LVYCLRLVFYSRMDCWVGHGGRLMGKGSRVRKMNITWEKWAENHNRIFREGHANGKKNGISAEHPLHPKRAGNHRGCGQGSKAVDH
jgi:hypothetical protein